MEETVSAPRRLHRVTIKDLARDLGMSVATVARAFHADAAIADATRQAVLGRASQLGYQPNALARSMITRRTRIVGVVLSDLANPFYSAALAPLTAALQGAGYNVMLVMAEAGGEMGEALRLLLSYQPECAVILATTLSSDAAAACREAGTPLIFLNRHPGAAGLEPGSLAAVCDNSGGAAAVAGHLAAHGARRLGLISGRPDASTNAERCQGFLDRCAALGLPPPLVEAAGEFTYAAGQQAARRLLARPDRPEALFCTADILALGAMDVARHELGLAVPGDIAIAGFDDIPIAAWPSHDLTSLRQPVERMVAAALDWITLAGRGEAPSCRLLRLPGELVVRGSTVPLQEARKETACSLS
ncbi:LacI family DNA-binding transcriptional regulator [Pseudoroseomonas sp. WGS1072]|uniref:LacI family DNA-binding transcriptional regulator n=1 Tax=Roseomonas sp. WGS1072 TaxID=3366816 RepID=UPI003BF26A41